VRSVGISGEQVGGAVKALGDATLRVEGVERTGAGDTAGAAGEQPVRAEGVEGGPSIAVMGGPPSGPSC
jgi:hypothetical protein